MKKLFKSKLVLSLITTMLLTGVIVGSLAGNISRVNAQAPNVSSTRTATPTVAPKGTTVAIPKPKVLKPPEGKIKESAKKSNSRLAQPSLAWSINLRASATIVNVGQNFMLTAQTNYNVGPTPYYIQIYWGGRNYANCNTGTSCSTNLSSGTAGARYTFYARVSNSDGSGVQAVSNGVTISIVGSSREQRAMNWARSVLGNVYTNGDLGDTNHVWNKKCDNFVAHAYGLRASGYLTAIAHYNNLNSHGLIHTSGTPPAGTLVFFRAAAINGNEGHVMLSEGNGYYITASSTIQRVTISWPGAPYLGWAYANSGWPGR